MNVFKRNITPTRRIEDIKKKVGNLLLMVRKLSRGGDTIRVNARIIIVANIYIPPDWNIIPRPKSCIATNRIKE